MKVSDIIIKQINEIAIMFHPEFTGPWNWCDANNKTLKITDKNLTELQCRMLQSMHNYLGEDRNAT